MMKTKVPLGLYVHVPFCRQKCAYCDFYSLPCQGHIEEYFEALTAQISAFGRIYADQSVDTVFFGGGTPSVLGAQRLSKLAESLRTSFDIIQDAEWSIEVNPKTVNQEDLQILRDAGFNRLSIGVQSLQDGELKALGRVHCAADAQTTYNHARRVGFSNISVDLMYGIPHQTEASFANTLTRVLEWEVDHLSAYGLKIEEGTPFASSPASKLDLPKEEAERNMYFSMAQRLEESGLEQYEISNFAREGCACRHNLKYWTMRPYLGFGPAAHGFLNDLRYETKADLEAYLQVAKNGDFSSVIVEEERLTLEDTICEYIMLHLRLCAGIDLEAFEKTFHQSFTERYQTRLTPFLQADLMRMERNRCYLTREGFYLSNYILSELLDF